MDSPFKGLRLLVNDGSDFTDVYKYASRIVFFNDPASYAIVKIAAIFDLVTFSSYSGTAILFAAFSFIGMWMFFLAFYDQYPGLHRSLAVASFFIPSVFFWGSGLLKDTVTMGCLGIATFEIYKVFIVKERSFSRILLLILSLYGIYSIKVYILLIFLPAVILWVFLSNLQFVRSVVLRIMLFPFVITGAVTLGYYAMLKSGEDNEKYALDSIAKTAQITAYDIGFYTGRDAGSGYSIGVLDGTFGSMVSLAPQAINVSLFRPYLWEVNNPLMLLSSLESFVLLIISLYILIGQNVRTIKTFSHPDVIFALFFSLCFAFAVGVSTFNFGTLVRYKIPMLPFFLVTLILIQHHSKRDKKFDELEITE